MTWDANGTPAEEGASGTPAVSKTAEDGSTPSALAISRIDRIGQAGLDLVQFGRVIRARGTELDAEDMAIAKKAAAYMQKLRQSGYAKEQARWAFWRKVAEMVGEAG